MSNIKPVILLALEILFIFLFLSISYSLAHPYMTSTAEDPLVDCNTEGKSGEIDLSKQNIIDVTIVNGSTVLEIPRNADTTLKFNNPDNIQVDSVENVEKQTESEYSVSRTGKSRIRYKSTGMGTQLNRLGLPHSSNFTILPETSNNVTFNMESSQNPVGRVVYVGDQYYSDTESVGCQEVNYFSTGNKSIVKHAGMLRKAGGKIPFEKNYTEINVIIIDNIQSDSQVEPDAKSINNNIVINRGSNTERLFLHEYIHTRQSYQELSEEEQRSWFIEGSAQYHASRARYDAGIIHRYEYLSEIFLSWEQRTSNNVEEAYHSDSTIVNHYAFGPRIFHLYHETETPETIGEYYSGYDANQQICNNKPCMLLTKTFAQLHSVHLRYPILYYGLYMFSIVAVLTVVKRRYAQLKN